MSPFSIAGKRVVVTGGARGIGASVCRALVEARAHVAIFDVLDTVGEPLATSLSQDGPGQAFYQSVDVSNRSAVFSAMDSTAAKLGGLDSVVNCAALERNVPIEELDEKDLTRILDVNVKGAFFLAQAAFPHLKTHGGVLLNFGSDGGLTGAPGISAYSASKGAIHSLTRMLALEWGKYGIRSNALLPLVMTPMFSNHLDGLSADERAAWDAQMRQKIPLLGSTGNALGDCEQDLAPVVQFLISDASRFITSQLIPVNGGLGSVR